MPTFPALFTFDTPGGSRYDLIRRGTSSSFPPILEPERVGQMGRSDCIERLYDRVHSRSPSGFKETNFHNSGRERSPSFVGGSRPNVAKECNRRSVGYQPGILFNILPSSKERWGMETSSESQKVEQIHNSQNVQDVDQSKGSSILESRGLVGLNRPERRILSRAYLSGTQTFPKVCISRKSLSVQSAPIRPKHGAKGFYQGVSSHYWIASLGRRSYISLLRRLSYRRKVKRYAESFTRAVSTHITGRRLRHQCKKVTFHSIPRLGVSGNETEFSSGQGNASSRRIEHIRLCCQLFQQAGVYRPARLFLRLLGLMTSSILLVPYARLYMRPFQLHLHARWKARYQSLQHPVLITRDLLPHVQWWSNVVNLSAGLSWLRNRRSLLLTTDASKSLWGGHINELSVQGPWTYQQIQLHINCQEMLAVFNCLKAFQRKVQGRSVVVRTDNTTVQSYINHYGGTKSQTLCHLTWELFQWCMLHQVDVRATYIPGKKNLLADHLSRQLYPQTEWSLRQDVANSLFQLWFLPDVDLFASPENHKLPQYCTLHPHKEAWAVNALSLTWKDLFVYAFPPLSILHKVLLKVREEKVVMILIAPLWTRREWYPLLLDLLVQIPRRLPLLPGLVSQNQGRHLHHDPGSLSLVAWPDKRRSLIARGLSHSAASTILAATSESTNKQYENSWNHFQRWCEPQDIDPFTSTVHQVLNYLGDCLKVHKLSYNTIKARVSAIASRHLTYGGRKAGALSLSAQPEVIRFFRGAKRTHPPVVDRVPSWDLPLVLDVLQNEPFEPLQNISLRNLTYKTAFLVAIASARRLGELHALDVTPQFASISPNRVVLRTNAKFLPKNPSVQNILHPFEATAFGPDVADARGTSRALCVCRALTEYVRRTRQVRQVDQLFVLIKAGSQGRPASKATIATWLKTVIKLRRLTI